MKHKITTLSADDGGMKKKMKALRAFLAMDDSKTDDEVLTCMEKLAADGKLTRKGPLDDAGGTSMMIKSFATEEVERILAEKLTPLTASITALTTAAQDATKSAEKSQRDALIAQAGRDHKIIPLSNETVETLSVKALQEMIEKLPKSNLQTRSSQQPLVKANSDGTIKKTGNSIATLSINGQTVEIAVPSTGGTHANGPTGLSKTSALFEQQLQRDNLYCRKTN